MILIGRGLNLREARRGDVGAKRKSERERAKKRSEARKREQRKRREETRIECLHCAVVKVWSAAESEGAGMRRARKPRGNARDFR